MKPINIGTLLDHISTDEKEALLRGILAHAFLNKDGEISPDKPRPGNPIDFLQNRLTEAIATAEKNIAEVEKVTADDEMLDDVIHDHFSDQGSEVNNGGSHQQALLLIVEAGWTAAQVNKTAEDFERSLSEIPR